MNHRRPLPNRRNAFRLSTLTGKNRVRVTAGTASIELIDLSATGGQLVYQQPNSSPSTSIDSPLDIELPNGETVRAAVKVVRRRSPTPGVVHVGAEWSLPHEDRVKLSDFIDCARLRDDSRALTVKNPLFIRNLLAPKADSTRPVMSVIDRSLRLGSQLRVDSVAFEGGRRVIRARVLDADPHSFKTLDPYEFVLGGSGAVTVFESSCLEQQGRDVTFALPAQVSQKSGRSARRLALAMAMVSASFGLECGGGDERVEGQVVDVADGGLSLQFRWPQHGLQPGSEISVLDIRLPGRRLSALAVVRSVRENPTSTTCGLELVSFHDPADAAAWRRFVFEQMHPNIVDGRGRAARSWAVLDASKYVDLWTASETREHIRSEYVRSWNAAAAEVGHSLVLERRGAPVGLSAASVAYPGSWILHHLARDGRADGKGNDPLAENCELISGICRRLETETAFEHFLIYIERDKRFNERLYVDFFERYFDKDKLMLTPMEVFRRSTEEVTAGSLDTAIEVVPATSAMRQVLAARLAETIPPLERRAFGFDQEDLGLASFTADCATKNYDRRREIFCALVDGAPQAALIAESGGEGVNIFGLLNTCRIVGLGQDKPTGAVRDALLRTAVDHYAGRGKKNFLFFDETDDTDTVPTQLGFQFVSAGLRWLAHRDVMPAWSAYLDGLLASPPTTTTSTTVTDLPRPTAPVVETIPFQKAS